jgi:hypothetical protein
VGNGGLIREGEREVGGDGVCGCSFGEPLKQETKVALKHNNPTQPNYVSIYMWHSKHQFIHQSPVKYFNILWTH